MALDRHELRANGDGSRFERMGMALDLHKLRTKGEMALDPHKLRANGEMALEPSKHRCTAHRSESVKTTLDHDCTSAGLDLVMQTGEDKASTHQFCRGE